MLSINICKKVATNKPHKKSFIIQKDSTSKSINESKCHIGKRKMELQIKIPKSQIYVYPPTTYVGGGAVVYP